MLKVRLMLKWRIMGAGKISDNKNWNLEIYLIIPDY